MNPELDHAYRSTSYRVMIPGRVPLDIRIGSARLAALARRGDPDCAGWMPEDSLLVLDIPREEAGALGRRFGQAAIVVGGKGAPELVYLSAKGE